VPPISGRDKGIAAAKRRGVYTGRRPALTAERARRPRERAPAGEWKSALAGEVGISHETVDSDPGAEAVS